MPVIWQVDRLKRMRAMSRMGGCSAHPESESFSLTSTGAPQCGQVGLLPSLEHRPKLAAAVRAKLDQARGMRASEGAFVLRAKPKDISIDPHMTNATVNKVRVGVGE